MSNNHQLLHPGLENFFPLYVSTTHLKSALRAMIVDTDAKELRLSDWGDKRHMQKTARK